jgi:hypothetical protein
MGKNLLPQRSHDEKGQTILLVAISLISLLAMAALAIDVVTLYSARSEIQRAADTAALAGAKAIADSGITTLLLTDTNFSTVQTWATTAATNQVNAALQNNPVAGTSLGPVTPIFDWTRQGDPQITVQLTSSNLPTFFSKIWKANPPTVGASATAEAYNPANLPNFTPIAPKGVKPWLVANADPLNPGNNFVDPTTGAVETGVTVTGERFFLHSDCQIPTATPCALVDNPPGTKSSSGGHPSVEYVPALITANAGSNVCPACEGTTDYERSIECADVTTSYQALSCGGGTSNVQWDHNISPGGLTGSSALGAECLTNATGTGNNQGQDTINNPGPWPLSPMQITAQSGAQKGNLVTTSSSIVTIPIIDTSNPLSASGGNVTIVGYLQAFIDQVHGGGNAQHQGDIEITVLNIAGCGSASTNLGITPVIGGSGTSPVPVRLITPP